MFKMALAIKNMGVLNLIGSIKSIFFSKEQAFDTSTDKYLLMGNNLVEEVLSSIISIVNSDDTEYYVLKDISAKLKELNNDNYSNLIKVLDNAFEQLDYEWTKMDQLYEQEYKQENWPDIAHNIVWDILRNKEDGVTPIEWTLKGHFGDPKVKFDAYHMDMETWELLKMYIHDSKGNDGDYVYTCIIDPVISEIDYPYCDCEMVSSTDTIQGNNIDSNCDTWGTSYGYKAQGLFAFYITDLQKFAIVKESYWVY